MIHLRQKKQNLQHRGKTPLKLRPILGRYTWTNRPTLMGWGVVIVSLEGIIAEHALRFEFLTTNNETGYEALIVGLGAAKELGVQDLKVYSDSQLAIGHIKGDCEAREENMMKYLQKVKDLTLAFHNFEIQLIPREDNI